MTKHRTPTLTTPVPLEKAPMPARFNLLLQPEDRKRLEALAAVNTDFNRLGVIVRKVIVEAWHNEELVKIRPEAEYIGDGKNLQVVMPQQVRDWLDDLAKRYTKDDNTALLVRSLLWEAYDRPEAFRLLAPASPKADRRRVVVA